MNGYLSWQIVKGLTFKSVFGYVQTDRNDNSFYGNITSVAMANANLPVVDLRASQTRRISNSNTLQYSPKLGSNHKLDVMIGQERLIKHFLIYKVRFLQQEWFKIQFRHQ